MSHNEDKEEEIDQVFSKKIDRQSGLFYHVLNATGESVWDIPHRSHIPLQKLTLTHDSNSIEFKSIHDAGHEKYCEENRIKREKRLTLIESRLNTSQKEKQREERRRKLKQDKLWEHIWTNAIENGKKDGNVRISSMKLGHISDKIYEFRQSYGIDLTHLSIVDNDLSSTEEIVHYCPQLVHLSLSSNNIEILDSDIGKLVHLRYLNLLRNRIETLPSSIGSLTNLENLELANNKIIELPDAIQSLVRLKRLNLECNQIRFLPNTLGKLKCRILVLNSNKLQVLPHCLSEITTLKTLMINDNCLRFLPPNIGNSLSIESLYLSKNEILELPQSLGRLSTLKILWLDYNRLTALPINFHNLVNLKELKMEGNFNMVFPTMDQIMEGPSQVLSWSKRRFARGKHTRQLNIVLSVQDILKQVQKYQIAGIDEPHLSIFEWNVSSQEESWYQFPIECFWNTFIPALEIIWNDDKVEKRGDITSFPYERDEMERTLATFHDAAGTIVKYNGKAAFRRCSCKDNDGNLSPCNLLYCEWKCERPAILVKSAITLESQMAERKRKEVEQNNVTKAVTAARKHAENYLSTVEGLLMIRELAEKRLLEMDNNRYKNSLGDGKTKLIQQKTGGIVANFTRNVRAKFIVHQKSALEVIEEELRCEYINEEGNKRQLMVEEMNRKMKKIMSSWLGLSIEEVFIEWKKITNRAVRRKRRDERAKNKSARMKYEGEIAILEKAKSEILQWTEHFDEFSDLPYWVNQITKESRWEEPKLEHFLPPGWTRPEIPTCLLDSNTGKLLTPRTIKINEMDSLETSSDASDNDSVHMEERKIKSYSNFDANTEENACDENEASVSRNREASVSRNREREILTAASRLLSVRRSFLESKMIEHVSNDVQVTEKDGIPT